MRAHPPVVRLAAALALMVASAWAHAPRPAPVGGLAPALAPVAPQDASRASDVPLANAGFETEGSAGDPVPGWVVEVLRQDVGALPEAELGITSKTRHTGRNSLRMRADVITSTFFAVVQELPARPGATYSLSAWTKTLGVLAERIQQPVCHVALVLRDAAGAEVGRALIEPERPRQRFDEGTVSLQASPAVRTVRVEVALGMSGELWVDDVSLAAVGGWPTPEPQVVFRDDFSDAGSSWQPGSSGEGQASEVRPEKQGDGWVMRFSSRAGDTRFATMERELDVVTGDVLYPSASARGAGPDDRPVDLRLAVTFLGDDGRPLGDDVEDWFVGSDRSWSDLGLVAVAPRGAARARLTVGLFGPGEARLREVAVVVESGAPPPFTGWQREDGDHVSVFLAPGHRDGRHLPSLVRELDRVVVDTLGAEAADELDGLSVYLHDDAASVRATTGREPPVSDPRTRAVHVLRGEDAAAALVALLGG